MSRRSKTSRSGQGRPTARQFVSTLAALAVVPAAALLALGFTFGSAAGESAPRGLLLTETRSFTNAGEYIASTAEAPKADEQKVDEFLNDWQNTVRRRPSPRR